MTIDTAPAPTTEPTAHDAGRPVMAAPRVVGLVCRNCRQPEPLGPSYVCPPASARSKWRTTRTWSGNR